MVEYGVAIGSRRSRPFDQRRSKSARQVARIQLECGAKCLFELRVRKRCRVDRRQIGSAHRAEITVGRRSYDRFGRRSAIEPQFVAQSAEIVEPDGRLRGALLEELNHAAQPLAKSTVPGRID